MIARTWQGTARKEDADAYLEYLGATGVPELEGTPGNRGVYVLRRIQDHEAHFLMISLWEKEDDIRAFAGDDLERARYYPADADFLLELPPRCTHYQVLTRPRLPDE